MSVPDGGFQMRIGPITFPEDETFDIGQDTRTGVA